MYQKLIQINKKVSYLPPSIWDFLLQGELKYQLHWQLRLLPIRREKNRS
jgi:hypothetical protein